MSVCSDRDIRPFPSLPQVDRHQVQMGHGGFDQRVDILVEVQPVHQLRHQPWHVAGVRSGVRRDARISGIGDVHRPATPLTGGFRHRMAVALKHPVECVQQALAEAEVPHVVEGLDVGHHPLVGEGFLAVVLRDLDVSLTLHQVDDVDRGHPEPLDRVRGRDGVRRQKLPKALHLLGGHPAYPAEQVIPHPVDLVQNPVMEIAEPGGRQQHEQIFPVPGKHDRPFRAVPSQKGVTWGHALQGGPEPGRLGHDRPGTGTNDHPMV